jgi:hypothetical protein
MFRLIATNFVLGGAVFWLAGCSGTAVDEKPPSKPRTDLTNSPSLAGAQEVAIQVPEMRKRLELA